MLFIIRPTNAKKQNLSGGEYMKWRNKLTWVKNGVGKLLLSSLNTPMDHEHTVINFAAMSYVSGTCHFYYPGSIIFDRVFVQTEYPLLHGSVSKKNASSVTII